MVPAPLACPLHHAPPPAPPRSGGGPRTRAEPGRGLVPESRAPREGGASTGRWAAARVHNGMTREHALTQSCQRRMIYIYSMMDGIMNNRYAVA